MKLTQELIDKIQEAMLHTKKDGSINWKDGDEVIVQLADAKNALSEEQLWVLADDMREKVKDYMRPLFHG